MFLIHAATYEVEAIVDDRSTEGGRSEFKVKWRGWERTTWEPESGLVDCAEALLTYQVVYPAYIKLLNLL